jgi:acyl-CoA dehydrogenase
VTTQLSDLIGDIAKNHSEPEAGELPDCWGVLVELGLPTIGIPESLGGSGGSLTDLIVVAQSLGRHGIGTPLVEAAVANWVVASNGYAPQGGVRTIALDRRRAVPWARHAEQVVVADEDGVAVAALDPAAVQCDVSVAGEPVDHVDYGATEVAELGGNPSAERVQTRLGIVRAAALIGAIEGTYQLTRTYLSTREQFGQPLIRIPAVATNLARIKAGLLQCEAALERAGDERLGSAAAARVLAGSTATEVARLAHQLHGAMGTTAEYPLHHYTERLWAWRDADLDQREWALLLGRQALAGGETFLWEQLTA